MLRRKIKRGQYLTCFGVGLQKKSVKGKSEGIRWCVNIVLNGRKIIADGVKDALVSTVQRVEADKQNIYNFGDNNHKELRRQTSHTGLWVTALL